MIYERDKQENGSCNGCGHVSWKYKDAKTTYSEEICLDSDCRYRVINDSGEIMDKTFWDQFLTENAEPHLTVSKV